MRRSLIILLTLCGETQADTSEDFARGADIVPYTLPWWHPEIQSVAVNRIPGSSDHPLLDSDTEFQRFIRANTDESHRFFDGARGYIQRPRGFPGGHPNCDNYFVYEDIPEGDLPTVYFGHPDIHEAYLNQEPLPQGHPSASGLLQKVLPIGHPDVDDLFLDHEELPEWHPDLSLLLNHKPIEPIYVFSGHPDLKDDTSEPVAGHPTVHHRFESHLPESHPNIDDLIQEGYTLPSWHPDISMIVRPRSSNLFSASPGSSLSGIPEGDLPTVYFDHPDIHEAYLNRERLPQGHPSASGLLQKVLPNGHPDVDDLFLDHEELPEWHPELSLFLHHDPIEPIHVFIGHPDLKNDIGEPVAGHPAVHYHFEAHLPESHPNIDDLIQEGYTLPSWHPDISLIVRPSPLVASPGSSLKGFPEGDLPTVYFDHPDIHEAYFNGERLPQGHPSTTDLLRKVLPNGHPDVDDLFLNHEELPDWHPQLSLFLIHDPIEIEPIYVFSGHPDLKDDIVEPVDDHPTVRHIFEADLPDSHPNIDDLIQEGFTLPSWHPDISSIVRPRPLIASPGSILGFVVAALLLLFMLSRNITRLRNSKRTTEVVLTNNINEETSSSSDEASEDGDEILMYRGNHESNLNSNEERVLVYKEKRSNWKNVFGRRVVKSSNSTGEVMICLLYVLINLAALWISPTYSFGLGFGSLSAGNTVFTFMTAARNSMFTWFLGVAFDQVLVYHRFIGRLTFVFALAHSCFYIDDVFEKTADQVTVTGLISLGCGFVIVLSSVNYVRRKFFNLFFWIHCGSFIGFLVGLYMHASASRPFVFAAIGCYAVDKGLQMSWKMPKRTTIFEKVDERTTHVRFAKSPLNSLFGRHRVGQYVFVNFPSLSLQEWHPFSVASGPSDPYIDLYIRGLGDHTKKIVEYSERCAVENKQVRIRVDGPYGTLPFNYRRYGSILFVGGGIGITPILGILKDIYDRAGRDSKKNNPSHCIRNVSVVWTMPHAAESSLFLDRLYSFHLKSLEDPLMPDLKLSIHVTREIDDSVVVMGQQIVYSKPQFDVVMDECIENKSECLTSMLVYACGPGGLVKQLWDVSTKKSSKALRVDFYHEKFEF